MRFKILSLMFVAVLLLAGITCKEAVTPFSPQTDVDNQNINSRTTSQNASTETQIKDIKFVNEDNKKIDAGRKPGDDARTAPHSNGFSSNYGYNPKNPLFKPLQAKTNSTQKTSSQFKESSHHNEVSSTDKGTKKSEMEELNVQVHPDKWNVNWEHSQGLLTVCISGEGYEDIDPESLRLSISGGGESISPWMAGVKGSALVAKFLKIEAIGLIDSPQAGQSYDIQVAGNFNGEGETSFGSLTDTIIIAGQNSEQEENDEEGDEVDLSLKIKPDEWSLSWASTADNDEEDNNFNDDDKMVTATIKGQGFEDIDPDRVSMSCTDPGEKSEISPVEYEFGGKSFKAKFPQDQAIELIKNPERDNKYTIVVSGQLSGGSIFSLSCQITIHGKKDKDI